MKKIIFGAMAAAALLACSQDQVIEQNRANDEITFSVVADNQTKAADIYCNYYLPKSFNVYASLGDITYIDGDVIEKQGDAWVNTSGVRYWPDEGSVTFYANVNAGDCFKGVPSGPTIKDFEVPEKVNDQVDLLYAVKTQGKSDIPVELNFRHALSQVVFQAKNTNANLYVEIKGVSVCNLGNVNTFIYNTAATDDTIINHDGTGESVTTGAWGSWNDLTGGDTDYAVEFTAVPVPGDSQVKSLTNTNADGKEYSTNAMLLLPQTTNAWAPADGNGTPGAETQKGTYFLVDCKICNVAGDEYADTDIVLWNGPAAIPAQFSWEQGKKYIYTFVFGNGNGGYDPDPDDPDDPDDPNDPDPVLVPIEFEIAVDDFVPVANQDIAMETK